MKSRRESLGVVYSFKDLHGFAPNATRALWLDQRMRLRLRDSLRHIFHQASGQLDVPPSRCKRFLTQLKTGQISPLAFSFYSDTVLAIEENDLEQATELLDQLTRMPVHDGRLSIIDLPDPARDATGLRYARFINDDDSVSFEIFSPSPAAAASCRAQIKEAFALMSAGDPELAAEIRALLRQIILAAGNEDPKALTFDGASAFMLWGAIIINANRSDGPLAMVQMLAHESAHNLLFGFSAEGPLVENTADELYPSPLRADPRPMDGIYHATFVTARMHRAVRQLLDSGNLSVPLRAQARKDLAENARLFAKGYQTVAKHARMTAVGEAVMRGASEYMAGV